MTNWQEGDPLSPTNLNSRIPSWVSTSAGTGVIFPSLISGIIAPVFNVKTDFGAIGDGTADDTAAIQSAFSAAAASATIGGCRTVFFPPGNYHISQPVWVRGHGTKILGHDQGFQTERQTTFGYGAAVISASTFFGPLMIVEASDITFPHTTAGLTTSGGTAVDFTGVGRDKISLADLPQSSMSGNTQFCFQCFFKSTATPTDFVNIASSSVADPIATTAFQIFEGFPSSGTAPLRFTLNLAGGSVALTGTSNIADGVTHYLETNYDGTNVRLFVDGTQESIASGSGVVQQGPLEVVNIGAYNRHPAEWDFLFAAAGKIDSPHFSTIARNTANYTAPTAKHTRDANTLMLLNFDEQKGRFTKVATASATQEGWARYVPDAGFSTTGVIGVHTKGLHLVSTNHNVGILWGFQTGFASLYHCNFSNLRYAIQGPHGNHFNWHIAECFFNGDSGSLAGLALGLNSPDGHIDTAWFYGFRIPFILSVGAVDIENVHWITAPGEQNYAALVYGTFDTVNGSVAVNQFTVDLESGVDATYRGAFLFTGGSSFPGVGATVSNCIVQTRNGAPLAIINGPGEWTFNQCDFQWFDGVAPASVMQASGGITTPALFDRCTFPTAWLPLSDTTGTAIIGKLGTQFSVSTGSTIKFDGSLYDSWDLTLTSDVTQSSWTKLNYAQPVSGAIKMDSTGSRLFVWPTNSKGTATLSYGSAAINTFTGFYDGVNVILTSVRTGL